MHPALLNFIHTVVLENQQLAAVSLLFSRVSISNPSFANKSFLKLEGAFHSPHQHPQKLAILPVKSEMFPGFSHPSWM